MLKHLNIFKVGTDSVLASYLRGQTSKLPTEAKPQTD